MTNDYAALVAMLDQAAADLQAEIDSAIDRHGLLVRTAATLRGESDSPERRAARVAHGAKDARHCRPRVRPPTLARQPHTDPGGTNEQQSQ